jgi:uncharacterized protein YlxW (UPF0749 family)
MALKQAHETSQKSSDLLESKIKDLTQSTDDLRRQNETLQASVQQLQQELNVLHEKQQKNNNTEVDVE